MTCCRSASLSVMVTSTLLPVEVTVAVVALSAVPVRPSPSLTYIFVISTTDEPAFTVSLKVIEITPVPALNAAEDMVGAVLSAVSVICRAVIALEVAILPVPAFTSPASICTCGSAMAMAFWRSASPKINENPVVKKLTSALCTRTSVAVLNARVAAPSNMRTVRCPVADIGSSKMAENAPLPSSSEADVRAGAVSETAS